METWRYECKTCGRVFEQDSTVQDLLHRAPVHSRADMAEVPCVGSGSATTKLHR